MSAAIPPKSEMSTGEDLRKQPLSQTASAERHGRMTVRIRATEQRGHLIFFLLYFIYQIVNL